MRTILSLTLLTFTFLHTSISQEINYQQATQIIVGDHYSSEDVEIIKEEIINSNKQNSILKLLVLENDLYSITEIEGKKIAKPCVESYLILKKEEDNKLTEKSHKEVLKLKEQYEKSNSESIRKKFNRQVKKFNTLNENRNKAINSYNNCLDKLKKTKKEYNELIENLYKAYTIKKTNVIANNSDVNDND